MGNKYLTRAKDTKDDEFYTGYDDIKKELVNYAKYFKGKVIYCNCDDHNGIGLGTPKSNFLKYLADNFEVFQIKKVIATHYEKDKDRSTMYILDKDNTGDGSLIWHRAFSERQQREVYEKQGKKCAICKKHFLLKDMDGHHCVAFADGGETTIDNCLMLCKNCHIDYHAQKREE